MTEAVITFWQRLAGWRTYILNLAIGLAMVLAEIMSYMALLDWKEYVDPIYVPWVVLGVNVLNIVLRRITTKPAPVLGLVRQRKP